MDKSLLVSLVGFAFVSSATPGPNNLLLVSSGALFGWRKTVPLLAGILLGFALLMAAAVIGLGTVVSNRPWLVTIVRVLGAAWLAWMGLRFFVAATIARAASVESKPAPIAKPLGFFTGVMFQWINPKALILALSSAGAYIAIAELAYQRAMIIVSVFFLTGLVSCTTWMVAGNTLNRYMASGRIAVYVNVAMGLLLLMTAVHILVG